jgi:hypothetical protein
LIEDQGLQYNFVAYGQVEQGELLKRGYRVLILPHSSSLSLSEANAIKAFVRQGGTLVVDGDAGTFDEHSRKLAQSSLADLFAGDTGLGSVSSAFSIPKATHWQLCVRFFWPRRSNLPLPLAMPQAALSSALKPTPSRMAASLSSAC